MGVARYHYIDIEELDFLRNLRYYQHTSPKETSNNNANSNNNNGMEVPAVVDIYNSTKQILIEPGVIDTLGNALMHLAGNTSSSLIVEEEESFALAMMDNVNVSIEDNFIETETDFRHSLLLTVFFCIAYVLVFIIGFLGNLLTVAVVYRLPRMRSVTNYFIVSLAIADILVLMLCLPGTLMSNIFVPWVLGRTMCKVVPFIQGVAINASVYSLIAVSHDRFLAICYPLKFQMTTRAARIIIACIWTYSLLVPIPWLLFFDLVPVFKDDDTLFCLEIWPDFLNGNIYFLVFNVLLGYLIPLIVISVCYIFIYIKVWKRDIPTDSKNAQMERMQQNSKIKVIKMLLLVVIMFVASWAPLYIIFSRIKLGGDLVEWEQNLLPILAPIAQFLGIANSSINPILYAFFNNKFRTGFWTIIHSKQCCTTVRYYDTVNMANSSSASLRKSSYYTVRNKSLNRQASQDKQLACISEGPIGV